MPCPRLCIDDLCHGNRNDTLCGGCYCECCNRLAVEPGLCDDCRFDDEDGCEHGVSWDLQCMECEADEEDKMLAALDYEREMTNEELEAELRANGIEPADLTQKMREVLEDKAKQLTEAGEAIPAQMQEVMRAFGVSEIQRATSKEAA